MKCPKCGQPMLPAMMEGRVKVLACLAGHTMGADTVETPEPPKRHKYGVAAKEERTQDGITFASKAEMKHYQTLLLRLKAGEISDLQLQPSFPLVVNGIKCGTYRADFQYVSGGTTHVVDVKGMSTPVYTLKKKLVKAIHGIDIEEVR